MTARTHVAEQKSCFYRCFSSSTACSREEMKARALHVFTGVSVSGTQKQADIGRHSLHSNGRLNSHQNLLLPTNLCRALSQISHTGWRSVPFLPLSLRNCIILFPLFKCLGHCNIPPSPAIFHPTLSHLR